MKCAFLSETISKCSLSLNGVFPQCPSVTESKLVPLAARQASELRDRVLGKE